MPAKKLAARHFAPAKRDFEWFEVGLAEADIVIVGVVLLGQDVGGRTILLLL